MAAGKDSPVMDAVLTSIMKPLARHFDDRDIVEVRISRPGRIVVDRRGAGLQYYDDANLTQGCIERICRALANKHGLPFDADTHSKVSCTIPGLQHRFECLVGASVQSGLSLTVRCKHPFMPSWTEIGAEGATQGYLYDAMAASRNMIVSGATNTGKTTLINMLLEMVPTSRRVIGVEDTPELDLARFDQGVGLLADRDGAAGGGHMDWRQLYDHTMRITPDHIVFGEISTGNAWAALSALNSGVTGFMCTIHAESPRQVIERKFAQNIAWSGQPMKNVRKYLAELVDCIIQLERGPDGYRRITEIYEPKEDRTIIPGGGGGEARCA